MWCVVCVWYVCGVCAVCGAVCGVCVVCMCVCVGEGDRARVMYKTDLAHTEYTDLWEPCQESAFLVTVS